jgi:glycosyltransferase involved in cell wall biosynthesis
MVFRFAPHSGGSVIVGTEIANNLAKIGHKITVLTPDLELNGEKYSPNLHSNIKIVYVQTPSKSNLKVAARRCKSNLEKEGIKLGEKEKFDFVLTIFHPFHLVPNAAITCAKKLQIPVLVKIDDAIYDKSSGIKSLQRRIEKMVSTRALKNATKILVVNKNTKKIMHTFYNVPFEKIEIIPNGVDLKFFRSTTKISKKIVFSGVMYHHRGLDVLLESLPQVIQKFSDVRIVLLGDGPEMERLQSMVKEKHLESNVEFRGWINRNELPQQISDASIAIGPLKRTTVTENALPIKVLEYMASSLPILAISGTLPDDVLIHGKNGYFVNDSKELEVKICELLENSEKIDSMGNESLKMVQKFSWEKVVSDIIQSYEDIKNYSLKF